MPKICFTSLLWTSLKFPGSWLNWRWRKCLVEKKGRSSSGVKLFFTNWEFSASFTWSCHGKIWQVNDLICQLHVQWFHPECSYFTSGSERSKQVEEISNVLTKSLGIISIKNSGTCFFSRQKNSHKSSEFCQCEVFNNKSVNKETPCKEDCSRR